MELAKVASQTTTFPQAQGSFVTDFRQKPLIRSCTGNQTKEAVGWGHLLASFVPLIRGCEYGLLHASLENKAFLVFLLGGWLPALGVADSDRVALDSALSLEACSERTERS
jgi:hypothetical protein